MRADPILGHFADAAASVDTARTTRVFGEMHDEIPGASAQRVVEGVDVADMVACLTSAPMGQAEVFS